MTEIIWFSVLAFFWLIGLSLLAEIWFYEEEQEL
jgi:hypothetical protein